MGIIFIYASTNLTGGNFGNWWSHYFRSATDPHGLRDQETHTQDYDKLYGKLKNGPGSWVKLSPKRGSSWPSVMSQKISRTLPIGVYLLVGEAVDDLSKVFYSPLAGKCIMSNNSATQDGCTIIATFSAALTKVLIPWRTYFIVSALHPLSSSILHRPPIMVVYLAGEGHVDRLGGVSIENLPPILCGVVLVGVKHDQSRKTLQDQFLWCILCALHTQCNIKR